MHSLCIPFKQGSQPAFPIHEPTATIHLQRLKAQATVLVARGGIVTAAAKVAEERGGCGLGMPQVDDFVQMVDKHLAPLVNRQWRQRLACTIEQVGGGQTATDSSAGAREPATPAGPSHVF